MKTPLIVTAALFALMPLAGCASIVSGTKTDVQLTSQPSEAQVTVTDGHGRLVFAGKTPVTASLKRGSGPFQPGNYKVTFTKDGYVTKEMKIKYGVNGWYIGGNFFFGGLIGWLIVDPLTGAMWTLESNCCGQLTPTAAAAAGSGKDLQVVGLDQVPPDLQSRMRPLP